MVLARRRRFLAQPLREGPTAVTEKLFSMRRGTIQAFSLAELLLSLALLTVALVTVGALFISMYRTQEKASRGSTGVLAAETVLNTKLHAIFHGLEPGLSKTDFFNNDAPPQPSLEGRLLLSGTEYIYKLDYSTVPGPGGAPLGSTLAENRLKLVSITCWWWTADATATRAGFGKQTYSTQRLVNENDKF